MATWFAATGFGGLFAGWLATLASLPQGAITVGEKLAIYQNAFFDYAYLAFFIAIVLIFVNLGMNKLIK